MIPSAMDLVEAYRRGEISPVEATQSALDAIDRYDDQVNAFVLVDVEGALAAAKESEIRWHAGEPLGPVTASRRRSRTLCGRVAGRPCAAAR